MVTLAEIYGWFMTGKKPTQAQFWASWGSFWNKGESIPQSAISNLTTVLNAKAEKAQFDAHKTDMAAHATLFNTKEDKTKKGVAGGYVPLDEFTKIANEYLNIVNDLVTGGATSLASAETVKTLKTQIDGIKTILSSNDVNLDTVQKVVDAIKTVQNSLSYILVNDLTTGGTTKALTAEMGKTLKGLVDALEVNKANRLTAYAYVHGITYTFTAWDFLAKRGKTFTNTNPVAVTVPTNAAVPIDIGSEIIYTQYGDGVVTIGGVGITFVTNLSLSMVKGETRILRKIDTDTWSLSGNLPKKWKTYKALLTSTGATPPTAYVQEDELGDVTYQFISPGYYSVMSNSFSDYRKVFFQLNCFGGSAGNYISGITYNKSSNQILIRTSYDGSSYDTLLQDTPIIIQVLN